MFQTVEFRNVGTVAHAMEPWPRVFLVTRTLLAECQVELRPLTLRSFFGLVLRNWATDAVWRLRRLAWRVGFIDFDERRMGESGYGGTWRWWWWAPRVGPSPEESGVSRLRTAASVDDWAEAREVADSLRARAEADAARGVYDPPPAPLPEALERFNRRRT